MFDEYAEALNLSEYERQCVGFYEESSSGLTEEEDASSNRRCPTNRSELSSNRSFREHAQDIALDWDGGDSDEENGRRGDFLDKLMDALTTKSWLSPSDENNNNERQGPLSQANNNGQPSSASTQVSSPAPHDLLSAVIFTLLDEFACTKVHLNGDANCFECRYKAGFKSLAVNYLEELKYAWDNRERFSPLARNERLVETLQLWIYHLSEQNLQLGRAYSESMDASQKLKKFLLKSKEAYKSQQLQHDIDRSKIDVLTHDLSLRDQTVHELRMRLDLESDEVKEIKSELSEAQSDLESLTKLVLRLRDNGVWDIHGLPMSDPVFQRIFNGHYHLHGKRIVGQKEFLQRKREWKGELDQLRTECDTLRAIITAKDREIEKCKASADASTGRSRSRISSTATASNGS